MEQFLNLFFFIDKLPGWVLEAGRIWGIDMACLCALPNFFNLILHFIIGGIIITAIMKQGARRDLFFVLLLLGIILSGTSKFIDWVQNMLTATGQSVFFSYNLDITTEVLQFLGMAIIFYSLFRRFFRRARPAQATPV
ncbi:MAG: hypothetical protein A3D64_02335 [Candidatus Wildermuthbacteria bacterium RIFCSPHIGHO2_02_FULL_49_9]|uniref:Uncharacterized protein n=2 Tax=Candidatus Wildermuthiibacteriota TaxID=1817923 RepID=A0A1G2QZG8_9BACT|nr:MAG: hypothetical protein A2672_01915 [Candidatus Wildermuthbacteria bacterium RIFCSPHIGHO2_01_FULL_49_22b]OHA70413.1 MAG: hypothetical protein A3D64_02335 [Candidatus Wildermuthbacteria bacterium RIFCSPHIGHO2_02_FULL_49_9]